MSLLTQASLILTPNAYKESKLYSIFPSDGNGDMTFTRATTATSVNSEGLIEDSPYNLLGYSEVFSDNIWGKGNTTISANVTTSPDGQLTADRFSANGVNATHQLTQPFSFTASTNYTFSIYAKADTNNFIQLVLPAPAFGFNAWANFNVLDGTIGTVGSASTANIVNVGNGWFRCSITAPATTTIFTTVLLIVISSATSVRLETSTLTTSLFIWGAQLVTGTLPRDYFPTTNRLNVPRLNYDVAGGCPSILLEPQRTSLTLNSVWAGGGSAPTSWTVGSIDTGTATAVTSTKNPNVTAYRFVTSTQRKEFIQSQTITSGSVVAFSCYVESVTTAIPVQYLLRISGVAPFSGTSIFLKNNVTISGATNIEAGNMYSVQFTCTATGTGTTRVGSGVTGDITGDITVSMPQLESGSYATSFIPTTTGIVTRNADVITRNDIYTNGLITADGGTWFVELNNNFALTRDAAGTFQIGDSSGNNISIKTTTSNTRLAIVKNILNSQTTLYTTLTNIVKIAIIWNGTKLDIFVNGAKISLSEINRDFTTTNMNSLTTSIADVPRYIKSVMLFPVPLTDTECINLTTL